jgi:hypothetical protein
LLPSALPKRTWGGFGNDDACAVCGNTITAAQLESEFEDAAHRSYHVHIQCFAIWETVLAAGRAPKPALTVALNDGLSVPDDPRFRDRSR